LPWRPPDVSPVNEVRRNVVNDYSLTPQAAESLYRVPTEYKTYVPLTPDTAYVGQATSNPEWLRNFYYATGLRDYQTPITVRDVYAEPTDPRPIVSPESTLLHEWTHNQQFTNPALRAGMKAQANTPEWYAKGTADYGLTPWDRLLGFGPQEAHATLAQDPWQFSEAQRQQYYPSVFQPNMGQVAVTWR
jgi:hypothetical protein